MLDETKDFSRIQSMLHPLLHRDARAAGRRMSLEVKYLLLRHLFPGANEEESLEYVSL